uniref:Uncharacterized protein n=1 Tax=Glossina palpalis gambiensis TaxID=67801 RepID=A0A1B0BSN6_9MUSC
MPVDLWPNRKIHDIDYPLNWANIWPQRQILFSLKLLKRLYYRCHALAWSINDDPDQWHMGAGDCVCAYICRIAFRIASSPVSDSVSHENNHRTLQAAPCVINCFWAAVGSISGGTKSRSALPPPLPPTEFANVTELGNVLKAAAFTFLVLIDFDCEQTIEAIAHDVMWMLATSKAIVSSRWQNVLAAVQAIMTHHVLSLGIRIVVIAVLVDIAIYVELVKVVSNAATTTTTTTNAIIIIITIAVMVCVSNCIGCRALRDPVTIGLSGVDVLLICP